MSTLPAGYLETGASIAHNGSLNIHVAAIGQHGSEPVQVTCVGAGATDRVFLRIETIGSLIDCGDWDSADTVQLKTRKFTEGVGAASLEDTTVGGCPQPYLVVGVSEVISGLRLAVTATNGPGALLTYRLWADELTTHTLTVGSKVLTISHTGELLTTPGIIVSHQSLGFIGFDPADLEGGVIFSNASWGSETDPTLFDNFILRGYQFPAGGETVWTYATYPPLKYTVDVRVEDAGGATVMGMVQAGNALVSNPAVQAVTHWRWGGTTTAPVEAVLEGDWSSGGVSLPTGDEVVPLRQIKPKDPESAPQSWTPATFTIASPLNVLLSSNTFVGSGSVAVSGTGNQTWTVTGAGAATRTLLEKWRDWNNAIHPDFQADDGFRTTKHNYYASGSASDVWGWHYAYLDVDLTAPANGNVTLTITWVAAKAVPDLIAKTYTIPATTGRSVYRVDLLFPNEGGPFYGERVDILAFSGMQNGVYTLHDLELPAVEEAYVKLHARGSYSGLVLAQDGSFAIGQWGDNPLIGAGPARQKDDESGLFDFGAGADTSIGGCVRMDGVLQDVTNEWHRMEGITTTYSGAAIDADLTDGTNTISLTKTAKWYHTQMGARAPANAAHNLPASLYLDGGADLCAAPAGTFYLPFRHTLGMVLEALAKDGVTNLRAGVGAQVFARRSLVGTPGPSDPLLGSALTDASGFVSVAIRDGLVGGSAYNAALLGS